MDLTNNNQSSEESFHEDYFFELGIFKILFPEYNICFLCLVERNQNNQVQLVDDEDLKQFASQVCNQKLEESVPMCDLCIAKAAECSLSASAITEESINRENQFKLGQDFEHEMEDYFHKFHIQDQMMSTEIDMKEPSTSFQN